MLGPPPPVEAGGGGLRKHLPSLTLPESACGAWGIPNTEHKNTKLSVLVERTFWLGETDKKQNTEHHMVIHSVAGEKSMKGGL